MRDDELISDLRVSTQTLPRIDVSQDAVWSGIRRRRTARTALGGIAAIGVTAAAGLAFAFASAGDRGSVPPAGATPEGPLATYPTDGSGLGNAALLTGTLGLEGDCLYVTDVVGTRYILALPQGYATWDGTTLVLDDGQVVPVGDNLAVGGGVAALAAPDIAVPAGCAEGEVIWQGVSLDLQP